MKNKFDVLVVGSGPAGLFAAYEVARNSKLKVAILEKGHNLAKRKRSEVMSGVGGTGTFSDGKLHFSPNLSHEKLFHLYTPAKYVKFMVEVEKLFLQFGVKAPISPNNQDEARELVDECRRRGVKIFTRKLRHVGSDKLPGVIANFVAELEKMGVEIITEVEVTGVILKSKKIKGVKTSRGDFLAPRVIMAPGRVGSLWLQDLMKKLKVEFTYDKVEVGVRVEFPAAVTVAHNKILYEAIYAIRTPTFDDIVRTFCPCQNGHVATEDYGEYLCVNGHSTSKYDSPNSNFAFVCEIVLTEPVENTTSYAIQIAKLANMIGGGKPLIQRLKDLQVGRRSTWARIKKSFVEPSLTNVTPGDIDMALPHRTVTNILEGLEILNQVLPGISSGGTLLYAPEIKLRSSKVVTGESLETAIGGLYVAGDASGLSGNIVGAAVTGMVAGRGIVKSS
ncbi:FAD-binding protein [Patescibacteria group bacterium]|nr:FAD-binding protein [Patescibacteria group bacterium]